MKTAFGFLCVLLGTSTFANAQTEKMTAGQSMVICEAGEYNSSVIGAVQKLNARLRANRASISSSDGSVVADAPYSVSAPAITSYGRGGAAYDYACVTITKQ